MKLIESSGRVASARGRRPPPWRRSVVEPDPPRRPITRLEAAAAIAVVAAVCAFAVWFLFFASGGPGWGTL